MQRFLFSFFLLSCLATAPQPAAAQEGGFPIKTTAKTQFVFQNGEVMRREGQQTFPLTQNVKLSSGVKINYKNGIVELPGGKKTTLQEGDYVQADGGIVFATAESAAAAKGQTSPAVKTNNEKYIEVGTVTVVEGSQQIQLLNQKIELLNQKINILSQGRSAMADTRQVDEKLRALDTQIMGGK